jgi:hypothetical protein
VTAWLDRRQGAARLGAGAAVVAIIIAAAIDQKAAAAGWLVGFAFWSQVLIGCLALTMIHRLTSGRWGEIVAPVLTPTAAAVPLLLILVIPIFAAIPVLYPWARTMDAARPDVLSYYLNVPFFILRTIVALAGWTMLAILLPRIEGRRGQLLAAASLVFHCVVTSSVAIDWYLSLEAPFTSSSFGASVAITQLIAALAWAALLQGGHDGDSAISDVGGLLLAFVLGITYVDFMAVLVIWYGDLSHAVSWFVERQRPVWQVLAVAAFILASVAPILSLMLARVRSSRAALRLVSASTLAGLACYDAYLIAPPFGTAALVPALLALIGMGLALFSVTAERTGVRLDGRRPARVP